MNWETITKEAYQAYGEVTEFKNYQGLPMPAWEDLPERIKLAWVAAVQRALWVAEKSGYFDAKDDPQG